MPNQISGRLNKLDMKVIKYFQYRIQLLALLGCLVGSSAAFAQGTAFTYQGRLAVDGNTTNGVFDFTFTLFGASSGGSGPRSGRLPSRR